MAVSMAMLALPVYPTGMHCVTIAIHGQGFIAIEAYMQGFFTIDVHIFFLMLASNVSLIMLLGGDRFVTVGAGERSKCLGRFVLP